MAAALCYSRTPQHLRHRRLHGENARLQCASHVCSALPVSSTTFPLPLEHANPVPHPSSPEWIKIDSRDFDDHASNHTNDGPLPNDDDNTTSANHGSPHSHGSMLSLQTVSDTTYNTLLSYSDFEDNIDDVYLNPPLARPLMTTIHLPM